MEGEGSGVNWLTEKRVEAKDIEHLFLDEKFNNVVTKYKAKIKKLSLQNQ